MLLTTSIVISTYSRADGVYELLQTVAQQTVLPEAIYVVDQNPGNIIFEAVEKARKKFLNLKNLIHLKADFQGLTKARNYGLARVTTPLVTFIDDDVTLGSTYIADILKFFEEKSEECHVVGGITQFPGLPHKGSADSTHIWTIYRKIFQLSRSDRTWRILPNFEATYNGRIAEPTKTEFISGSNFSVRTVTAKNIGFDENLFYYSIGEDLDFPVRLRREYGEKVWLNPRLPVYHPLPADNHWTDFILYVHSAHHYYLFYKYWNGAPPLSAFIDFVRSRLGIVMMPSLQRRQAKILPSLSLLRSSLAVEAKILKNFTKVVKGQFPKWK